MQRSWLQWILTCKRPTLLTLRPAIPLTRSRHHICQKNYATAIFGPKNLCKKSVNRDKIEFATKWRKCYKMTLKRENGQLTLYHHLFGNCQFCTTVHGI